MDKPVAKMVGKNGNVFNLIGIASKALKEADQAEKAKEMLDKILKSKSYDEALQIMMEYVEID